MPYKERLTLCTPSAFRFSVITHKVSLPYASMPASTLCALTKNLTAYLTHDLCAALSWITDNRYINRILTKGLITMFKLRRFAAFTMAIAMMTACLTACGDTDKSSSSAENGGSAAAEQSDAPAESSSQEVVNFTAPEEGEDILVLNIKDKGEIKIKLFPKEAKEGVENIKGLCDKNYYDGVIFHRIIKDFMIQGGDPTGTGMGGESIFGDKFDGGASDKLINCAGAVVYANSGSTATNGSQFYIVTGTKYDDAAMQQLTASGYTFSDEAKKIYAEDGGAPWLDGGYTVFGQVFDGLDVVFDVQNVETDASDKPLEDVVIESMKVEKYDGGDVKFHMSDYK